jgi:hypothetical protein
MSMREADQLRRAWVARVMGAPGLEILAVQTLRNSIMAATVMASTSALVLMGLLGLGQMRGTSLVALASRPSELALLLPVLLLVACVVLFSQAVRLYHRCSYRVALTDEATRELTVDELLRAARLYRGGWWSFYLALAAGAVVLAMA